jgi:predicted DNA-binding transcriptional regulator
MSKIVPMEDPKNIIYRSQTTVDEEIDQIEKGLKNEYYAQLSKIWRDDAKR